MKATIIVPTIREDSIRKFLTAWEPEFRDHRVIVVEDNPEKTFTLPTWVAHVSWKEIDAHLKDDAWIIPRRSDTIRNYGFLLAAWYKDDMIVTMDDDCLPCDDRLSFLNDHWFALETPGIRMPVFNTMFGINEDTPLTPRGYPKEVGRARTVLNHGLWNGVPDLDGETQLKYPGPWNARFAGHSIQILPGVLFPMCGMNLAFRPEILPAMYFLPMGKDQPFHRFGDIWCGLIMKKACDKMGWSVRSGIPFVLHSRASDPKKNAELEALGMIENEKAWSMISGMDQTPPWPSTNERWLNLVYACLADLGPYWKRADEASSIWRRLVRERMER